MSGPTIDRATFDALKAPGAEFVLELVDTFLQEAPAMLETAPRACGEDVDKFRRRALAKSNSNTGALTRARWREAQAGVSR